MTRNQRPKNAICVTWRQVPTEGGEALLSTKEGSDGPRDPLRHNPLLLASQWRHNSIIATWDI